MYISTFPPGKKSDHVEKSNTVIQKTDTTVCLPNGTLFNSDCEYTPSPHQETHKSAFASR